MTHDETEARERWYRGATSVVCPECGGVFRTWFTTEDGNPVGHPGCAAHIDKDRCDRCSGEWIAKPCSALHAAIALRLAVADLFYEIARTLTPRFLR